MFTIITMKQLKRAAAILLCALVLLCGGNLLVGRVRATAGEEKSFIKWVDFNVPYEALDKALKLDVASHGTDVPLNWVELLAYLAAKNGGEFKRFKASQLDAVAKELQEGKTIEELTEKLKYYSYYREAYGAVLDGLVGEYEIEVADETAEGGKKWVRKYGLKGFSPIAKTTPTAILTISAPAEITASSASIWGMISWGPPAPPSSRWKGAQWRRWAGTNTAAGGSAYAATIKSGIIITPICGRISPSTNPWRWGRWCSRGT